MKKRLIVFLSFIIVLGINFQSVAQFTPEEVAERAKWEDYLATAEVVGQEQMGGREAVTNPWRLTLEKDGIKKDAIWKNPEGRMRGFIEGWKWEIAAYRMDKLLGLNMVPPTVEKRFQGNRGSCQLWAESEMSLKTKEEQKTKVPPYKIGYWNRGTYLQRAFDNLIANEDRHMNQILLTKDWRMILIDHSRSFRTSKKFTESLIYTEKHKEGPKLMSELPRALVEKIKALNFQIIKDAVGEYLTDDEINAVLARKELVLKEIDRLIAKNGEANVLYD
jgi:hypothetical protein